MVVVRQVHGGIGLRRGFVLIILALVLCECVSFAGESKVKIDANIVSDKPALNYVIEVPYKLVVNLANGEDSDITITKVEVSCSEPKGLVIQAKLQGEAPTLIPKNGVVSLTFDLSFPKEAAGKEVTLVARVDYERGKFSGYSGFRFTQFVAPQIELNLLPQRSVLHPHRGVRAAISIINNTDDPFIGTVTISPYAGIQVNPAFFDARVDPRGLEVYTYEVTMAKGVIPGHYAVTVDAVGRSKEWAAVEVPLAIKRAPKVVIDGDLDDWKDATKIAIQPSSLDGKPVQSVYAAFAYFAYDADNLYIAYDVPDPEHVDAYSSKMLSAGDCITMGFDPQFNGAASSAGGYREDDYEYQLSTMRGKPVLVRARAPKGISRGPLGKSAKVAFKHDGKRSQYEMVLPWTEIKPFKPANDTYFGLAIKIEDAGRSNVTSVEWGGGMGKVRDPRLFLPVMLLD